MKRWNLKVTSEAAFTVEFRYDPDGDDYNSDNGLDAHMATAFVGSPVFWLSESWRRGKAVYVFREKDRAEVTRRLAPLGIVVPEAKP